jgi:hypothetical protein
MSPWLDRRPPSLNVSLWASKCLRLLSCVLPVIPREFRVEVQASTASGVSLSRLCSTALVVDGTAPDVSRAVVWLEAAPSGLGQLERSREAEAVLSMMDPDGSGAAGGIPVLRSASAYVLHWTGIVDPDYPSHTPALAVRVSLGVDGNSTGLVPLVPVSEAESGSGAALVQVPALGPPVGSRATCVWVRRSSQPCWAGGYAVLPAGCRRGVRTESTSLPLPPLSVSLPPPPPPPPQGGIVYFVLCKGEG